MKTLIKSAIIFFSAFVAKAENRPNVIIILSDDQGYGDFSCHGNPILKTPNLDKLHGESIRFDNFHVAPLSTPTRGQLLTGMDALHNKASTVLNGCCMMRRDVVTMPEIFSSNGYKTGIFGKWHLGDNYPDRPIDRGFHKAVWIQGWGILSESEFNNDYYKTRYIDSLTVVQSDKYCSDLWFDKSMEWMEQMQDQGKTFFTYIALNAPHGPFQAPREDFEDYCSNLDQKTAMFFGMIQNIDKNMKKLDHWLDQRGLKDNTLVIFMNDNGGTGGVQVYNAGMRDEKGSIYDGGHRAACFIRWPEGNFGNPRTVTDAAQIQDLLPTFIDLFGFSIPENTIFDGTSLKPVLTNTGNMPARKLLVQQGPHVNPKKYNGCVIYNEWRLVGENELYNIASDPGQQTNVAEQNPGIYNELKAYYDQWWTTVNHPNEQYIPLVIGATQNNPVTLTSADWVFAGPNTQWNIALAKDNEKGYWEIDAKAGGTYKVELSRWPFHINRKLTMAGPPFAVGGTAIRPGKAVPIEEGSVVLNNGTPLVKKAAIDATSINYEMQIPAGRNTFKAWFNDSEGKRVCGAYYVRFEKIN